MINKSSKAIPLILYAMMLIGVFSCIIPKSQGFSKAQRWAEKAYNKLSLSEKVGQLFMVAAYSNQGPEHQLKISSLICQENIGGLIFFQGTPKEQARLTNLYQAQSTTPLLIGMDAEFGLGMRLNGGYKFPVAMLLGATSDTNLTFELGEKIGQHAKRLGVHINFAPVADVNTEPKNPIIGLRSFGSSPLEVSKHVIAYAQGTQKAGVMPVAKHFPGHGNTRLDSHKALPVIHQTKEELGKIELFPFKKYADKLKEGGIMVAHLLVPALGESELPASLSSKIIQGLLKNHMGFKGLIFTDALNMKAVKTIYPAAGSLELKAFIAGNDVLLFSENVKEAKNKILSSLSSGELSLDRLKEAVMKILIAKYEAGLHAYKPIEINGITSELSDKESESLHRKILAQGITVLKNDTRSLPIQTKNVKERIAYIPLGKEDHGVFYDEIKQYAQVEKIEINPSFDISKLAGFSRILISAHSPANSIYKVYQFSDTEKKLINSIALKHKTILSVFSSPYSLVDLNVKNIDSLIVSYQNSPQAQMITPAILFGQLGAYGKLPVSVNGQLRLGAGFSYDPIKLGE